MVKFWVVQMEKHIEVNLGNIHWERHWDQKEEKSEASMMECNIEIVLENMRYVDWEHHWEKKLERGEVPTVEAQMGM